MQLPELTEEEVKRYNRHLILPGVGSEGQRRLKAAKVLIIGAGGLASPAALYLSAAGVGTIGIADFDCVEESNLQRQIIHSTKSIGKAKTKSAKQRMNSLNPYINVLAHNTKLNEENSKDIIKNYDIVADCSDNFETRYLVNDTCVFLGKPNVHGSVYEFEGQVSVFCAKEGPCYRCLYPEPPLAKPAAGMFGTLPGIVGCIQANEILKIIIGKVKTGYLLLFNSWEGSFRELKVEKDMNCPACVKENA